MRRGGSRRTSPSCRGCCGRTNGDEGGLFHRDPKRIVGVLRVTLLNRLNGSREWAELPLSRQTLHHDWPSGYRGLQTPLFILSLNIELAHSLNLNVSGTCSAGEKRKVALIRLGQRCNRSPDAGPTTAAVGGEQA
jgi:hypothetical protein